MLRKTTIMHLLQTHYPTKAVAAITTTTITTTTTRNGDRKHNLHTQILGLVTLSIMGLLLCHITPITTTTTKAIGIYLMKLFRDQTVPSLYSASLINFNHINRYSNNNNSNNSNYSNMQR